MPATTQVGDQTPQISSPPEGKFGATDAPARDAPAPDFSASSPRPTLINEQRPTEGSAPAATEFIVESPQAVPVVPVTEPPRAEQRTKRRYSKPFFNNEQIAGHWAYHRTPTARPTSPSSYNEQLAPQSN